MKCITQDINFKCFIVIVGKALFFYSSREVLNVSKSEFMCQKDKCIHLHLWMLFRNIRKIVISKMYFKKCLLITFPDFNYQTDIDVIVLILI